jgi:hypothetical protein
MCRQIMCTATMMITIWTSRAVLLISHMVLQSSSILEFQGGQELPLWHHVWDLAAIIAVVLHLVTAMWTLKNLTTSWTFLITTLLQRQTKSSSSPPTTAMVWRLLERTTSKLKLVLQLLIDPKFCMHIRICDIGTHILLLCFEGAWHLYSLITLHISIILVFMRVCFHF